MRDWKGDGVLKSAFIKFLAVLLLMPMTACEYQTDLSLKPGVYGCGLEISKGSAAGEFRIVIASGANEDAEVRHVEEFIVRQHPDQEKLQVVEAHEYDYRPEEGDAARAQERELGTMVPETMSVVLKDGLLIVNASAYSLRGDSGVEGCERSARPLPEGFFPANHPLYSRVWVDVTKGSSEGEFKIKQSGSEGAMEETRGIEYIVRQDPNREKLDVIKAYRCTYTPKEGAEEVVRTAQEIGAEDVKKMSLIVKGNFLIIDGFVYSLGE